MNDEVVRSLPGLFQKLAVNVVKLTLVLPKPPPDKFLIAIAKACLQLKTLNILLHRHNSFQYPFVSPNFTRHTNSRSLNSNPLSATPHRVHEIPR